MANQKKDQKNNSHDSSSILGDKQHRAMTSRSSPWASQVSKDPDCEHFPKCDIRCVTMGKKPQPIQKHFHKILTKC